MRTRPMLLAAAALTLAACQPPAGRSDAPAPIPGQEPPGVEACNDVAPNMGRLVSVEEPLAAAAQATLAGGPINPGTYDLVSATRIGRATGWADPRAAALSVTEADGATIFNWASAPAGGTADRWTAAFTDTPNVSLTYTCGRMGVVEAQFAVEANRLHLRVPDGGAGSLDLVLERRS